MLSLSEVVRTCHTPARASHRPTRVGPIHMSMKLRGFWGGLPASAARKGAEELVPEPAHHDEPSGMWQLAGPLSRQDASSEACAVEHDTEAHAQDGPALDYVQRYPAPVEDDPYHPGLVGADAATSAAMLSPDMHAPLRLGPGVMGGTARQSAMLAQLRQRALAGSSDEEETEADDWQSMNIPALLLSPHRDSALHSLSSEDEPEAAEAPDFADLTLVREADEAAQAAAEHVPPELQPLARAANILGVHIEKGRLWPAMSLTEPPLHLQANRFAGLTEPLTAEQLATAATLAAAANNIAPAPDCGAELGKVPDGENAAMHSSDAGLIGGFARGQHRSNSSADSSGNASSGSRISASTSSARAAALAAVAEEGVEWLDGPAAAAAAAAREGERGQEERSVQLRRHPNQAACELAMDTATRIRVAEAMDHDFKDANAHVVRSSHVGPAGHFVLPKTASSGNGAAAAGKAVVMGAQAASSGKPAADKAAAELAAEARQAVWGEGGWPYGAALQSADVVEDLRHSIQQQQEEAKHGVAGTLLP